MFYSSIADPTAKRIVWSRALTNSGDQAWNFAVPVTLAIQLPERLDLVAFVFFVARLGDVLLLPLMGTVIDRLSRLSCFRLGLTAQFLGVLLQAASLLQISSSLEWAFCGIVVGGILSSLGAHTTDIAVSQDLVPSLFQSDELAFVNSKIRQVDLFAEVAVPFFAGLLLLVSIFPYAGMCLVALWNLVSFFPEYFLIRNVLSENKERLHKPKLSSLKTPLWAKLSQGWKSLSKLSVAWVVFAYALLWLSALSPHGVLLTSFLREALKMPEPVLGIFRGLGAVFGLVATVLFPYLVKKMGLLKACRLCISSQALTLLAGLIAFYAHLEYTFLAFVLLSRIGLYGFSLGEQQLRQLGIPAEVRGSVNSTATALTGFANLFLLGLGSLLGSKDNFHYLILFSVIFVSLGALLFVFSMNRLKMIVPEFFEL